MEKRLKLSFRFGQPLTSTVAILSVVVTVILLGLWIPALYFQLTNFGSFKLGMTYHSFPDWIGETLAYGIPLLEALVIALLVSPKTNYYGMWLSSLILFGFTTYIGLELMTDLVTFGCYCSKLIADKSWEWHFWFNLTFLFLSYIGIYLTKLQRSGVAGGRAIEGGSAKRPDTNKQNLEKHLNLRK